jgi:hypothetical protein
MHIYNWYQSIATVILLCTQIQITIYGVRSKTNKTFVILAHSCIGEVC